MTPRRLLHLAAISLALIAVWIVIGLFTASEFHRRSIAAGGATEELGNVLRVQMVTSLIWAAMTPIIIFIAERLPLRKPNLLRNSLLILALLPVIAIGRAAIGGVVLNLSERDPVSIHMIELSVSIRTHRNAAIAAMLVVITNLVLAQREAAAREKRELEAQALLARAQLDELRAQIQPEFLFASLQSIAGSIESDPAAADEMIVALADQLRLSLQGEGGRP
jgi:hypothetical protein